jgi:putative sigma-54 modulation protein
MLMDISVTFRHMKPAESIRIYAEEKLSKIKKYLDAPIDAHVVLSVEKFRHIADVTLSVNGILIKGIEETDDMYSAIDQVMDKLETQVKKSRSKIRNRRTEGRKGENAFTLEESTEEVSLGLDTPRIEVERLVAKPIDPEEAAMQLSASQQDFLIFRNSRSEEINVIYKRKDGNLGLVLPSS